MEANQVHLVAASVFCDLQQIIHAVESRFASKILGGVGKSNRRDRIHDYVALIHPVMSAYFYTRTLPDTNTASDYPEPDSRAKPFGEHHNGNSCEGRWSGVQFAICGIVIDSWWPPATGATLTH